MSYLPTIGIVTVVLLQPLSSHAKSVDQQFKRCASAALAERKQSAAVISVNPNGLNGHEFDHDLSGRTSEYRMRVTNKVSGEELGTVTCTLSRSGKLLAAAFDV